MKIWITAYALTKGIFSIEVEEDQIRKNMVPDTRPGSWGSSFFHGEHREWHRTKEDAIFRAKNMRNAKIASLKKQIDRLEKLRFDDED